MPEITRMMTLSTAHIKSETSNWLLGQCSSDTPLIPVYAKGDEDVYGFYVYIDGPGCLLPGECGGTMEEVPDELVRIVEYARSWECQIVCLDCAGPRESALPTFEWGDEPKGGDS